VGRPFEGWGGKGESLKKKLIGKKGGTPSSVQGKRFINQGKEEVRGSISKKKKSPGKAFWGKKRLGKKA